MKGANKKLRYRYYIDKKFQNRFILGYSSIILIVTAIALAMLFLLRENPYSLLPNGAAVLVDIDANKGIFISKEKSSENEKVTFLEGIEKGNAYFPVKTLGEKLAKYNAFDLYWLPFLIICTINIILIMIFGLFFSHRLAGPIRRIKASLQQYIETGNIDYLKFRKRDHFQDVAELLNGAFRVIPPTKNIPESSASPQAEP